MSAFTEFLAVTEMGVDLDAVVPCQLRETFADCTHEATLRGRKDCCPVAHLACRSCAAMMTALLTQWWQETYGTAAPCTCGGRTTAITWRSL